MLLYSNVKLIAKVNPVGHAVEEAATDELLSGTIFLSERHSTENDNSTLQQEQYHQIQSFNDTNDDEDGSNDDDDDDDGRTNDDDDDDVGDDKSNDNQAMDEFGYGHSYSACLLIMDDNHRLPEWLAYHYYAVNLRYLVVAVDPSSRTSPSDIFQAWRQTTNLTIVEWTDEDFTSRNLRRKPRSSEAIITAMHRTRQWVFYSACTKHLKAQGRKWTFYMDTDEYLTINQAILPDAIHRISQPGSIPRLLEELRNDLNNSIPKSDFYRQNRTCYTIPRRLYSAVESSENQIGRQVPEGFDPVRFDTMRYRFRAQTPTERNGYCKSIIDVSSVPDTLLVYDQIAGTTHRPVRSLCPSQYVEYVFPIGIHHYMGSLESFTYRDDPRKNNVKSVQAWKKRAMRQEGGFDDEIRPWLDGFVKLVGKNISLKLLEGAGVLPDTSTTTTT